MKKQITFVDDTSGEWIGIYINGKLVDEGHSFQPEDVLRLLNIDFTNITTAIDDRLPRNLADVERA